MDFQDGILQGVAFRRAKWSGGPIVPEIVILHDTASRLTPGAAARDLADNDRKVSAHFVIERSGALTQLVPIHQAAYHAGQSSYHGREKCNEYSIGVEIVNPGRMTRFSVCEAQAWYGERFDIDELGIQEVTTPEHGHGLWMPYTESQLNTLLDLLPALFRAMPSLKDITAHWYVSPGRKTDTNPLFPLEQVRSHVFGREDPVDKAVKIASQPAHADDLVMIHAPEDSLNLRRWPSFNPNVIGQIPDGAVVPVLREGVFDGRHWLRVLYGGREGWIVARYADPLTEQENLS
ncbi:N-acetylmuramoyl-L-alanine amidase [Ruegeria sediminis]|uniref:1,6-anhydro-N-acetylmuramyl-L-alanine amidase AmpD n=1 Tax=Ruegeria sediminis TaxID=2583820 RepID=A0ABY2X469_9RHOB|nr:N-acetylmuramoyl-L-alanine amidase [Ruegeria sediminis]TMV09839.1 N-acetylmuramoyl-L-alanine amidase [Ruegeria sediminis]